ncbi:MAG: hypothetical protein R3A48_15910 [Polyangiales bacterium]
MSEASESSVGEPGHGAAPLPEPLPLGSGAVDEVMSAWRGVVLADASGDADSRAEARIVLIDALLALDAASPAWDVLKTVESIAPRRADAQDRRAALLLRSGPVREWAQQRVTIARRSGGAAHWEQTVRAWVRADELSEALACAEALLRVAPTDPKAAALQSATARLRSGARRSDAPASALLERAHQARQREERDAWRALSVDAWIESHGEAGGELLVEALVASGRPRAAVYTAMESAARASLRASGDVDSAMTLLVRAARLAESAAMLGEATAAWSVAAMLPDERRREAREALRDLLAERGRVMDLSARLRADARRSTGSAAAAAWKGVAAVELPASPALAVQALLRALWQQPEDAETQELLRAIASEGEANEALRDGLWTLVHWDGPRSLRSMALRWLGELEEQAGDPASALLAWGAIDEARPDVFEAVARVHAEAQALTERASEALHALVGAEDADAKLEALLQQFAATPGAFVDLRALTRTLGPSASRDPRIARLWFQVAARQGDRARFVAVARRVASDAEDRSLRIRAVQACLDMFVGRADAEATEFVSLLLDERPEDAELAAMLAALAEQGEDPVLFRDALVSLGRSASDPWERDVFSRFARVPSGEFAVFASCLAEPGSSQERLAHLARLHELVGDSAVLLALRTRAHLAQQGGAAEALAVAARFAAFDPLSPEASIAWFGAANVAGDVSQIADAAFAVTLALSTQRDIAAVARTAVSRLVELDAARRAGEVALAAARCGALCDRGLRAAVSDLALRLEPAAGARLLECAEASADNPAERLTLLRLLAARYAGLGLDGAELSAWQRLAAIMPHEALPQLLRLAPRVGDRPWNAQLLTLRLDATLDPMTRRRLLLSIAAEYAAAIPPRVVDAMGALDRIAAEQREPEVREVVVGAMLALAQTDAAIGRLSRWAVEQGEPSTVSAHLLRAARLADDGLRDPARAMALLRGLLRNDPANQDALELAESIAVRAGLSEVMLGIYAELLDRAAGPHGRFATRYRRAVFLERAGDDDAALRAFSVLVEEDPRISATLSAMDRLCRRMSRPEVMLGALQSIAEGTEGGVERAALLRRAATIARDEVGDASLALQLDLRAYQAAPSEPSADALRELTRTHRGRATATATSVIESLIDEQLAQGNQCWDDDARRGHALRAIEIATADGDDPFRVAAAVGLFLRQHPVPEEGVRSVRALVERVARDDAMRGFALDAPAMRAVAARAASSAPPPAATSSAPPGPPAEPEPPVGPTTTAPDSAPAPDEVVDEPAEAPEASWNSTPPPRTSGAQFEDATLVALRAAASHGNDAAASVLAARLSSTNDLRDEALSLQRRRFHEDPSRLDALQSMISLCEGMRRASEAAALTQVLVALEGRRETVLPPELGDLEDPPEGVARVLLPPRFGPYPELGAMLWEVIAGVVRRSSDRARFRGARRVEAGSVLGRAVGAAVRVLQLPRATPFALREVIDPLWDLDPSTAPPTVVLSDVATEDSGALRWILGSALEATRVGHLPVTAFAPAEAARWVSAVSAAFGEDRESHRDAAVSALAMQLLDGLPARAQRAMADAVASLGERLTYEAWREAVQHARFNAAMLVSGAFDVASAQLIAASANPGARAPQLIATWEPLRDLARFATSEEYFLIRWSVSDAARRRR